MRYTPDQINEVLKRRDVVDFLEERKPCIVCGDLPKVTRDGGAILHLYMAVDDPECVRGGNLDVYNRQTTHLGEIKYRTKSGQEKKCEGDRKFKRNLKAKGKLNEFYETVRNGEIVRDENGRWTFELL